MTIEPRTDRVKKCSDRNYQELLLAGGLPLVVTAQRFAEELNRPNIVTPRGVTPITDLGALLCVNERSSIRSQRRSSAF